jgi:surfactin synthase thioesterase subunit
MTSPISRTPTLVCFHHAGGGASAFFPWRRQAETKIHIHPVDLPGRAGRDRRTAGAVPGDMAALADSLAHSLADVLDEPHVLFGHSMGGLVAYQVATHRMASGKRVPDALVVAACPAPHLISPLITAGALDDAELGARLSGIGGLPSELLDRPEWLSTFVDGVRADLKLCLTHSYRGEPPLPCAIHAFGGQRDPVVGMSALAGWRRHTSASFALKMLNGGHFLVQEQNSGLRSEVFAIVEGGSA